MTTRRGSQYSIQSDGAGLRGKIDSSKGKGKGNIPSGSEFTQGSALAQRKVPEMPMISEPELELSMSNSNRYKSHSEGSDRHLHEPAQAVLHSTQRQGLGNVPQIHQGMMNSWHILQKFLTEEERVVYSNGWNTWSSKPQIKKIKEYHSKKKEASKEEAPVASTSKPQANQPPQEGKKNKKKKLEETIFPKLQDSKNQKRCHGQCLQHGQNFDGIQRQQGAKNETNPFAKEITLSPNVLNTLTELKDSILPLKDIKNSLLSLQ
ncbi:hypothetical protein O181_076801 [Austropuccinia psidii MF-1]|uniref:Uncharacterized protein n=1 Tax=Austropuccinia psidii MF-1 TaxID=1389203 RepID=A0A9Q3IBH9_9BASI|nr:hypothetical protein [Austropuccinia psidii MF-1]